MSGMSQQMPIDITSPTTPSDHGSNVSCPQSQPSHSGMCYELLFLVLRITNRFCIRIFIKLNVQ